jgi:hypothetical protein
MDTAPLARGKAKAVNARALSSRVGLAACLLTSLAATAIAQTGTIAGTVRTAAAVMANARAILDKTVEMRTDSAGRFQFRDVSVGRHTLEVLAIGTTPYSVNLIVAARDTLDFEVVLVKSVVLDSVVVEGSTVRQEFVRAYADRKRMGIGKFMDSMEVRKFGQIREALLFVPGVRCVKTCDTVIFRDAIGSLMGCLPNIWVDNQNWGTDQEVLRPMRPSDIMGIEVYTRDALIPDQFKPRGIKPGCGALVIWTSRFWPTGKGKPPLK